jgi:hypothetical protein
MAPRSISVRRSLLAAGVAVGLAALPLTSLAAAAQPRLLTAGNYAVMGGQSITNTGNTTVHGNLAISPGKSSSVTGFPPGKVTGAMDMANAAADKAQTDLATAYNDAASATPFTSMSGDLSGLTLKAGVYHFSSSALLNGTLTLDAEGKTSALWIFQIGSTLTTGSGSRVALINGAGGCQVYWQVGSSATLGTTTDFQGTLMALQSITMTTGATIGAGGGMNGGRALARNASLTMDTNEIFPPPPNCASTAPAATGPVAGSGTPSPTPTPGRLAPTGAPAQPPGTAWFAIAAAALVSAVFTAAMTSRHRRRT